MSEENTAPVEQQQEPAAIVEPKTNSVSYDSHRKLLGEKKAIQTELHELRAADELRKQEKLQANGKQDEVILALRKELADKDANYKTTTDKVAFDKFEAQCVLKAKELGCSDTESLMMYMSKERMASIQVDERLNANGDDLTRVVNELKELKPNLFTGSNINHNPVTMAGFKKQEVKTLREMSKSDIVSQLRNL